MKPSTGVFWTDTHFPFHHRRYVELAFKVTEEIKPDIFVHGGDFVDANCCKRHKGPSAYSLLLDELVVPKKMRARIDKMCDKWGARKIITLGNHDEWAQERVAEHVPYLTGIVDMDKLMGFTENGWEVTPYRDYTRVGKMNFTHDWESAGHSAALKAQKEVNGNSMFGHNHSAVIAYGGDMLGEKHVNGSFGALLDPKFAKYMYKFKRNKNWMPGIGRMYWTSKGDVHTHFIPFINGVAVVNDKEIRL